MASSRSSLAARPAGVGEGLKDATGAAAALEFALAASPMMLFLLGIIYVGLHFYIQQTLDYAVQQAARQVEIGAIGSGYTQSDFVSKVLCPNFGPACSNLYVDLHPVSDYAALTTAGVTDAPDSASTAGFQFCVGAPGQMMYAHVVYAAPSPAGSFLGLPNVDPVIANAAFINENPSGVNVAQSNGC